MRSNCGRIPWLAAILLLCCVANAHAQSLDVYGGVNAVTCPNGAQAHFYTQQIGNRWWLCDPAGHGFFMKGVDNVYINGAAGNVYENAVVPASACSGAGSPAACCTGAGTGPTCGGRYWTGRPLNPYLIVAGQSNSANYTLNWLVANMQRLQSWGFNTLADSTPLVSTTSQTNSAWNTVDHTIPSQFRLDYIDEIYATPSVWNNNGGCGLTSAVKDIVAGLPSAVTSSNMHYTNFGWADAFDPGFATCVQGIANSWGWPTGGMPNTDYLAIILIDEDGQTLWEAQGPDFYGVQSPIDGASNGYISAPYDAWFTLVVDPVIASSSVHGVTYTDKEVYGKVKFADMLASEYSGQSNVSVDPACTGALPSYCMGDTYNATYLATALTALNTAWGSSFTTLGTSDATHCSSSIHTCLSGGTYTAWGTGTGLLDEAGAFSGIGDACTLGKYDGTGGIGAGVCGSPVVGGNYVAETAGMQADMSAFEQAYVKQYVNAEFTADKNAFGTGYLYEIEIGGYAAPPRREVLQALATISGLMISPSYPQYCSVCTGTQDMQHRYDFTETYYGNGPWLDTPYEFNNSDSQEAWKDFTAYEVGHTQATRGQWVANTISAVVNAKTTADGIYHGVGYHDWNIQNMDGQSSGWGELSNDDNVYDGRCASGAFGYSALGFVCGEVPLSNNWCKGSGNPFSECTGVATGTVPNIAPADYACTGAGTPYSCCTGTKTGTCRQNYGDFVDYVASANAAVYPTLVPNVSQFGIGM